MRSIVFDPTPFGGAVTVHEAGWEMARWSEIESKVKVAGSEQATTYTPAIYTPGTEFAEDRTCAAYRYTRGNLVEGNLFRYIHHGASHPFSMFGDGAIYVSGAGQINSDAEANAIVENVFASNPGDFGFGVSLNEQVYGDGFGGMLRIQRNAFVNVGNGMQLCTWYDRSPVEANVFFNSAQMFLNLNCDGNEVVLPAGNLNLGDPGDDYHQPSKGHLSDYRRVHDLLCAMGSEPSASPMGVPAVKDLPGVAGLLQALSSQIESLGGSAPASCTTQALQLV